MNTFDLTEEIIISPKKEWKQPELVHIPKNVLQGSSFVGNDGGGVSTGS